MSDQILLKLAEQIPALVLFAAFFGLMLKTGINAVERRDKAFLRGLSENTKALAKLERAVETYFKRRRRNV